MTSAVDQDIFVRPVVTGLTTAERAASSAVVAAREAVKLNPLDLSKMTAELAWEIEGSQRALLEAGLRSTPDPVQVMRAAGLWQLSDIMAEVSKTATHEKQFRDLFKRWLKEG